MELIISKTTSFCIDLIGIHGCHEHTNRGLGQSTDDGAMSMELKKLGTTRQKHEDKSIEGSV